MNKENKMFSIYMRVDGRPAYITTAVKVSYITGKELEKLGHETRNYSMFMKVDYLDSKNEIRSLYYPCEVTEIVPDIYDTDY